MGPTGTARPERVVEAVASLAGVDLGVQRIIRTRIHLADEGRRASETAQAELQPGPPAPEAGR
jgi:hypothetical protein